jgi:excisionase family DNA binding protein
MTQRQRQDRHLHAADEPAHLGEREPAPLTQSMWSVKKTAEFLDVPIGTLYQWIHHRRGPRSYKVGGSRKFDPVDVRAYLRENVTEPTEQAQIANC